MLEINSAVLITLISSYCLPTVRILGIFTSAPLFSNRAIAASVRIALGVLMGLIVAPTLPETPVSLSDWSGIRLLVAEFLTGLSMGFAMRLVFTGVEMAGELISMTMGLGFATFFDPQSQGHTSAISQFMSALLILLFLASDLHLVFLQSLVDSFKRIPPGSPITGANLWLDLSELAGQIFLSGLQIALPILTAVIIMTITLGVLTRSAPQLNLFGIGFPLTLFCGLLMLFWTLPLWTSSLNGLLENGLNWLNSHYLP